MYCWFNFNLWCPYHQLVISLLTGDGNRLDLISIIIQTGSLILRLEYLPTVGGYLHNSSVWAWFTKSDHRKISVCFLYKVDGVWEERVSMQSHVKGVLKNFGTCVKVKDSTKRERDRETERQRDGETERDWVSINNWGKHSRDRMADYLPEECYRHLGGWQKLIIKSYSYQWVLPLRVLILLGKAVSSDLISFLSFSLWLPSFLMFLFRIF